MIFPSNVQKLSQASKSFISLVATALTVHFFLSDFSAFFKAALSSSQKSEKMKNESIFLYFSAAYFIPGVIVVPPPIRRLSDFMFVLLLISNSCSRRVSHVMRWIFAEVTLTIASIALFSSLVFWLPLTSKNITISRFPWICILFLFGMIIPLAVLPFREL